MTVSTQVDGLKALRQTLKTLEPGTEKELRRALVDAAGVVARQASATAKRGTRPKPPGVPHLADTIKATTVRNAPAVRSSSPYANVIHWGGRVPSARSESTRPKRAFVADPWVERAYISQLDPFVADLEERLEELYKSRGLA